jgi:hypothetical protein
VRASYRSTAPSKAELTCGINIKHSLASVVVVIIASDEMRSAGAGVAAKSAQNVDLEHFRRGNPRAVWDGVHDRGIAAV